MDENRNCLKIEEIPVYINHRRLRLGLQILIWVCFVAGCNLPSATSSTKVIPGTVQPTQGYTQTPAITILPTFTPTALPSLTPTVPAPTVTPTRLPPVTVEKLKISSKFMGGMERLVTVYLPGEYARNLQKRYKVLYVFDGQELPLIAFEQYLNSLISSHQIEPLIVVAIESAGGDLRHEELGAGPYINVFGWGTLSDYFNRFMISELLPKIASSYRTQPGAANTGVMGWSLGGLTAFYLAWQYPDSFGIVGAFSPSFWWRTKSQAGFELQSRVMHSVVRNNQKRPGLRMWFEAGTQEEPYSDINKNGVSDVIEDIQDLWKELEQKGYQAGVDMTYVQVEGGRHEVTTWARVLPDFLRWAFPAQN